MAHSLAFVISNYSLTFLVLGFVAAAVAIARCPKPLPKTCVAEALLRWHVYVAIGGCNLYNFVMHSFFGEVSARFIGWADSPFQFEVATASLGFAAAAFFAGSRSWDAKATAIIGPALFTLGAAGGHVYQMITTGNYAPGNAGVIFYMDIVVPIVGFVLLWYARTAPSVGWQRQAE